MENNFDQEKTPSKYPILARIIGVLLLVGIAVGNASLFLAGQKTEVNWVWLVLVVGGAFLLGLAVWLILNLIIKALRLELASGQTAIFRFFMATVVVIVCVVFLREFL